MASHLYESSYEQLNNYALKKLFYMYHKSMALLMYESSYGQLPHHLYRKSFHMYHKSMASLLNPLVDS